MKRKTLVAVSLIALAGFATANVRNPSPDVTRSFENSEWEIITKELEAGSTGVLEAKVNQQGKRTMYLEPAPANEMLKTCKILYSNSVTTNPSPCREYREALRQ